ncbi:MobV family relaxase [Myroides odoratimimus]|uniref:MobV family relaxase n=1 Tax=Myroides odoratimimus TaxID=76832 RepID=UPI0025758659|nr:MobV family relaxase [Myroides odoratimimus]MDM1039834.1 plasmid recombination protein [Myroides odoratimimus]MDM1054074.1 plasmid recombination protein [Myroides odoratimimus]MDM1060878.1 plasmid recombination protein [Myroides odoratimimus]MDM1098301.1 plasmid recombination protein [Myroides odoratimimus]
MGKVAYHVEKGLDSSGGLGHHIDRTEGKEHTYPHADLSRADLNQNYAVNKYCSMELPEAIEARIKDGYNGKRKIRTDAVRFLSHILSGTHEDMISIFSNEKKKEAWVKANFEFLKEQYGVDNIVRFSLHLDEKTPHIHAITIPLTKEGKLSAKEVMGDKFALQKKQTRYAEYMKPFGLERGELGSAAKHESLDEYRRRENQIALKVNEPIEVVEKKNLFGSSVDKDATIEKLQEDIKAYRVLLEDEKNKARRKYQEEERKRIKAEKQLKTLNEQSVKKVKELQCDIKALTSVIYSSEELVNEFLLSPEEVANSILTHRLNLATEEIKKEIQKDVNNGENPINTDKYIRKHIPPIHPLFKGSVWELLQKITKDRDAYENKLYTFLKETKEQFIKLTEEVTTRISKGFKL